MTSAEPTRCDRFGALDCQPPKDVVDERMHVPEFGILGPAGRLEASELKLVGEGLHGNAILQGQTREDRNRVEQARDGAAVLGDLDKDLARSTVVVKSDGDIAFVLSDLELVRQGTPRVGKTLAAEKGSWRRYGRLFSGNGHGRLRVSAKPEV